MTNKLYIGSFVKFINMFELEEGGFPALTKDQLYEVEYVSDDSFFIIDDKGCEH